MSADPPRVPKDIRLHNRFSETQKPVAGGLHWRKKDPSGVRWIRAASILPWFHWTTEVPVLSVWVPADNDWNLRNGYQANSVRMSGHQTAIDIQESTVLFSMHFPVWHKS